jgi:hypothetical protein
LQKHPDFRKYQYTRSLTETFFKMDAMMQSEEGKKELLSIKEEQFAKGNADTCKDV